MGIKNALLVCSLLSVVAPLKALAVEPDATRGPATADSANAEDYGDDGITCNPAEMLTQQQKNPDCVEAFSEAMADEQDKVDVRKFFKKYKPSADLEISNFGEMLQVRSGNTNAMTVAMVSLKPLIMIINGRVFVDESNDTSYSRRMQKMFKLSVAKNLLSPMLLIDEAKANPFDGDPDPDAKPTDVNEVGYMYSLLNAGTTFRGAAEDLVKDKDFKHENEVYKPGWNELGHVPWYKYPFHMWQTYTCNNSGGLTDGVYFIGDKHRVTATLKKTEPPTVIITGVLADHRPVEVVLPEMMPTAGLYCRNKYRRAVPCANSYNSFIAAHPDINKHRAADTYRYKWVNGIRRKIPIYYSFCGSITDANLRNQCVSSYSQYYRNLTAKEVGENLPAADKTIVEDGLKRASYFICHDNSCNDTEASAAKHIADLAVTERDRDEISTGFTGDNSPSKGEMTATERERQKGMRIGVRLQEIAIGMSVYSSGCKNEKVRKELKKEGVYFKDADGTDLSH